MNTLERLRGLKTAALDRMTTLNNRSRAEKREFTHEEALEYNLKRDAVVELNSAIAVAEGELTAAPTVVPAAAPGFDPADYYGRRSWASMSISEWGESLRRQQSE